ncbi:MAG TPA: hypothetical protein VKF32_01065 [Thermoanaerobaculia bacterium]|nr:hypothetical protein [Thermoanaerobaculia bacterium]
MESEARRRRALLAAALLLLALAFAFIGRAALSADDGTEMLTETLGLFVHGHFGMASPPQLVSDPFLPPFPYLHSRYGLFPSLIFVPFLAVSWPLRGVLGAAGLDAAVALAWAAGAVFASWGFLRLARVFRPDASPLWMPAFLTGTYLWAYSADSYVEPWAAGAVALAAAALFRPAGASAFRDALVPALWWFAAGAVRSVLWDATPVLLLAAFLLARRRADGRAFSLWILLLSCFGLAAQILANHVFYGSAGALGTGSVAPPFFVHPLLDGFLGTTLLPGRGVLLYAPLVLASLVAFRKLPAPARVLCYGAPLVILLVVARWVVWHSGSCWGPRHLLAVLPLLCAPAVLAPPILSRALVALGVLLNAPGVLVSAGAFQSYAELLTPPPGATWPHAGGDRVSELPVLTPLYGHAWLLSQALLPRALPAPWLAKGARETAARPTPSEFVSPWWARRVLGLPPLRPMLPRLLLRTALGYLDRGHPAEAARAAAASLELAPKDRDAELILREALARR